MLIGRYLSSAANWNLTSYRIPGHCEPVTDVTGVAISRIEAPFLMDEFREMAGKNACMTMGCLEFDGDSHESSALLSRNDTF